MLLAMLTVVGLTAAAAVAIVSHRDGLVAGVTPARMTPSTSPIDEAQRILAHRFAKGEITADEYDRMLSILRR